MNDNDKYNAVEWMQRQAWAIKDSEVKRLKEFMIRLGFVFTPLEIKPSDNRPLPIPLDGKAKGHVSLRGLDDTTVESED